MMSHKMSIIFLFQAFFMPLIFYLIGFIYYDVSVFVRPSQWSYRLHPWPAYNWWLQEVNFGVCILKKENIYWISASQTWRPHEEDRSRTNEIRGGSR